MEDMEEGHDDHFLMGLLVHWERTFSLSQVAFLILLPFVLSTGLRSAAPGFVLP